MQGEGSCQASSPGGAVNGSVSAAPSGKAVLHSQPLARESMLMVCLISNHGSYLRSLSFAPTRLAGLLEGRAHFRGGPRSRWGPIRAGWASRRPLRALVAAPRFSPQQSQT